MVLGDCKLGVCVYELGYFVFSWFDLYDMDYSLVGIGNWCFMVVGFYNGNESNLLLFFVWCKYN